MADHFFIPSKIVIGADALESAKSNLEHMGKKALIVCGPIVLKTGLTDKVTSRLEEIGIDYVVFSDITGEPTDAMIDAGSKIYMEEECDFLIGVGGGSPLDAIKAIGVMVVCGGKMSDYMGVEITKKLPNMVAIPTTAGTGSEATQFTIITDTENDVKMLLKGETLMPDLAIVDPAFTLTAPPSVTAATGLDALTHAVEAYTSKKAQPLTDLFAISAIRRIFANLPTAYQEGNNLAVRKEMSLAALEAGIAFNNSSVTIVHGMSRPIGALFHIPHGTSNALLLYQCLKYVMDGAIDRFAVLGREIGVAEILDSDELAAEKFIQEVKKICDICYIGTIGQYGVDKDVFFQLMPKMAEDAIASGSPENTRKKIEKKDILKIYSNLW